MATWTNPAYLDDGHAVRPCVIVLLVDVERLSGKGQLALGGSRPRPQRTLAPVVPQLVVLGVGLREKCPANKGQGCGPIPVAGVSEQF